MDERFMEQASALEQSRRDQAVGQVRAGLQGKGRARCLDCKDPIPPARRKAAPQAVRCTGCQTVFETISKGRKHVC